MVVIVSFSSFADACRSLGASVVVGPRALVMFSCFAALIWAALLTGVPISFLGSLTTYKVISLSNVSPTHWGICLMAAVGHGIRILRPVRNTVCTASRSVIAASCLAALCFLYALTWASCCRGLVGAGINEANGFLGEEVVLLP